MPSQLPDALVAQIIQNYKPKSPPYSLDRTHPHFKTHNVEWSIQQAKRGKTTSKFNTQPHIIYLNLIREYHTTGQLIIEGQVYK
jgi:hypothetical protein